MKAVIGIDPGITGGLVVTNGGSFLQAHLLPVETEGKDRRVSFRGLRMILLTIQRETGTFPVFLERAVPFGMGTKGAFTYGRGFEATVLAVEDLGLSLILVEPQKWAKTMHAGISRDIRAKAKSQVAVKRLFPRLWSKLPHKPNGAMLEGPMDALLIAGYGLRQIGGNCSAGRPADSIEDFY